MTSTHTMPSARLGYRTGMTAALALLIALGVSSGAWASGPEDGPATADVGSALNATMTAAAPAAFDGGDFSIDFSASAPFTYNHDTGGGAYDDGTIGKTDDVVESLEGGDFACGDIVTYLLAVSVDGAPTALVQSIEVDLGFLANTTGQAGAAHSDIVNVAVNYGPVQAGDGPGGIDSGNIDDGGSTATLTSESISGTLFTSGAELLGTIQIDDLEAGEQVIVRVDVKLACLSGSGPTGNLQGEIKDARVVSPVADVISAGAQTIPFKQIGNLAGNGEPLLRLIKTVTTATGTCGVDDVDELNVDPGDTVKYCYVLRNDGTDPLFDVTLTDDNATPGDASDDFTVALTGLTDEDGEADLGDLAGGGATATGEALVPVSTAGTYVNTADAAGVDSQDQELTDSDTATVNATLTPEITITKEVSSSSTGPWSESFQFREGDTAYFRITVENTGDVDLTNVAVSDPNVPDCDNTIGALAVGASTNYVCSAVVGADDLVNVATASGDDPNGDPVEDDDDATVDVINPALEVTKEVSTSPTGPWGESAQFKAGDTAYFRVIVENTGDVDLTNVAVNDPDLPGCDATYAVLAVSASETSTCSTTVDGDLVNTATATGDPPVGDPVEDDDDAEIDQINPAIEVTKEVSRSDAGPWGESAQFKEGDTAYFRITVENTGDVDLTNVAVSDPNVPACDNTIGTLGVGASTDYVCSAVVGADDLVNVATASGDDPLGDPVEDDDDATADVINPAIEVSKEVSRSNAGPWSESAQFKEGDTAYFRITVENTGDVDLTNVAVSDPNVPACDNTIGTLGVGASTDYVCSAVVGADDLVNVATASGDDPLGDPVEDDDDAAVDVIDPMLEISKEVSRSDAGPWSESAQFREGETAYFRITVENTGDVDLDNVDVGDPLAPDCDNTIGTLPAEESVTYVCQVDGVTADFTNTATATGDDPNGEPVEKSDTADVDVIFPSIEVVKEIATDAAGPWSDSLAVLVGTDLYYRFTLTNTGDVPLTNVTLTDDLYQAEVDATCSFTDPLPPTESTSCVIGPFEAEFTGDMETEIDGEVIAPGPIVNTAVASGDAPIGDPVTDEDTAVYAGLYWGFTPGFWKNRTEFWCTAYTPETLLEDAFDPAEIAEIVPKGKGGKLSDGSLTFLDALNFQGGSSNNPNQALTGAKEILMRAAVAALLNTCILEQKGLPTGDVEDTVYPLTSQEVIDLTNAALASDDRTLILNLATELDLYNRGTHDTSVFDLPDAAAPLAGSGALGVNLTQAAEIPTEFDLKQNYPNPFNPTTTIRFHLPEATHVSISVYNVLGQHVAELVNTDFKAGIHDIRWTADAMTSGVYFYRIAAGDYSEVRQMILMR